MNRNHPIPMKGGDEYDAFSNWRSVIRFRSKERSAVKRAYWQRARKAVNAQLKMRVDEFWHVVDAAESE